MQSFIVEEIEFDFDSEFISKDERIQLTQDTLGVWHVTCLLYTSPSPRDS